MQRRDGPRVRTGGTLTPRARVDYHAAGRASPGRDRHAPDTRGPDALVAMIRPQRPIPMRADRSVTAAIAVLIAAASAAPARAEPPEAAVAVAEACVAGPWPGVAASQAPDPDRITMTTTRRARGGVGTMTLRLASSPYGVALSSDGSYRYHVEISVEDLPDPGSGANVVWVATPELDRHLRLGTLGTSGTVSGEVSWNKFLVFVTAEGSADVESWSQRILLSALSPSGRMHTMAGHGPFSGEPCLDPRQ